MQLTRWNWNSNWIVKQVIFLHFWKVLSIYAQYFMLNAVFLSFTIIFFIEFTEVPRCDQELLSCYSIPEELENILIDIARDGEVQYEWNLVKQLIKFKTMEVRICIVLHVHDVLNWPK